MTQITKVYWYMANHIRVFTVLSDILIQLLKILDEAGFVYVVNLNAVKKDYFSTYIIEAHV